MVQKPKLTEADIVRAAGELGVLVPALKAVLEVESPRGGFQDDGQVSILFEPHKFSEYTDGRFNRSHPDLSYKKWGERPYGTYSSQHGKLQRAVALDRDAALMATSWGKPQILGRNWRQAGAKSLQDFINRMHASEAEQIGLMVNFIRLDRRRIDPVSLKDSPTGITMLDALRAHNWRAFARLYNGTGFRMNQYDTKLATAFRFHAQVLA